jgi:hypothetical protein
VQQVEQIRQQYELDLARENATATAEHTEVERLRQQLASSGRDQKKLAKLQEEAVAPSLFHRAFHCWWPEVAADLLKREPVPMPPRGKLV